MIYISLLASILLETTLITLPIVLSLLIVYFVVSASFKVFPIAFIAGIIIDALLLRPIGGTSLFFISFLFLLSLYANKFEVQTGVFVGIFSALGSLLYSFIFTREVNILSIAASTILSLVIYKALIFVRSKSLPASKAGLIK